MDGQKAGSSKFTVLKQVCPAGTPEALATLQAAPGWPALTQGRPPTVCLGRESFGHLSQPGSPITGQAALQRRSVVFRLSNDRLPGEGQEGAETSCMNEGLREGWFAAKEGCVCFMSLAADKTSPMPHAGHGGPRPNEKAEAGRPPLAGVKRVDPVRLVRGMDGPHAGLLARRGVGGAQRLGGQHGL